MPGLLPAQQVTGAANLQVLHGHLHTRPQIRVVGDGAQTLVGGFGKGFVARVQEVGVGPLPTTPHPATQLVQLA